MGCAIAKEQGDCGDAVIVEEAELSRPKPDKSAPLEWVGLDSHDGRWEDRSYLCYFSPAGPYLTYVLKIHGNQGSHPPALKKSLNISGVDGESSVQLGGVQLLDAHQTMPSHTLTINQDKCHGEDHFTHLDTKDHTKWCAALDCFPNDQPELLHIR